MNDKEIIPLYESTPTAVVSTRLPIPSKIQLMELAMRYKMTQGEYMAYMVVKILQNPDAFDPKKSEEKDKLINLQGTKLQDAIESVHRYEEALKVRDSRIEELQSDLEAIRERLDEEVHEAINEGRSEVSKASKIANGWMAKAKDLQKRLDNANGRLAKENIRDGSGFLAEGTLVQF